MIYKEGITVIEGNPDLTMSMLYDLCISSVISYDKDILFIDGKNSFNPYTILKMAKSTIKSVDTYQILSHIRVTRAFTEFQMKSVIEELDSVIKRWNPSALAISYLPLLFSDSDIKLFTSILDNLRDIIVNSSCKIIVTTSYGRTDCDKLLASRADNVIGIKHINDFIRIEDNGNIYDYIRLPQGQRCIESQ